MEGEKIIYVFDPLCGWCYGFTPILNRLRNELGNKFPFDILAGGMVTANLVGPISQRRDYLKKRIPDIERITGVKFGEKYLELLEAGKYISNSEPPCIAYNVFKSFRPDLAFELSEDIHHLYYVQGKDLNSIRAYLDLAEKYEISKHGFMERFQEESYKRNTLQLFEMIKGWGVKGFPSLIFQRATEIRIFMKGYEPYGNVIASLDRIIVMSDQEPDF
jgi:putative protein-disulfide isomerase